MTDWRRTYEALPPGGHLIAMGNHRVACAIEDAGFEIRDGLIWLYGNNGVIDYEPLIMARKPLAGTVVDNVLAYGCGALNIDGCRVDGGPSNGGSISGATALGQGSGWNKHNNQTTQIDRSMSSGRWPANILHDGSPELLAEFAQYGDRTGGQPTDKRGSGGMWAASVDGVPCGPQYGDTGSTARFFMTCRTREALLAYLRRLVGD